MFSNQQHKYTKFVQPRAYKTRPVYNSTTSTNLKKLDPIRNASLRIAVGAFHTWCLVLLEAGESFLTYSRKYSCLKYAVKVCTFRNAIIFSAVRSKFHYSCLQRNQTNILYQRVRKYPKDSKYIPLPMKKSGHAVYLHGH